jgi:VanZ family protein
MRPETLSKISWIFVFLAAVGIFYVSTIVSLPGLPGNQPDYRSIVYHFFAFFWLGMFLLLALVNVQKPDFKMFIIAVLLAMLYAATDEFHQLYVIGRACNFQDWLIDSCGILVASFLYTFFIVNKQSNVENTG